MKETIELAARVPAELDGERLDQAAARLFPEYSRSRLQTWIRTGELRVGGEQRRPRDKVCLGDALAVAAEWAAARWMRPWDATRACARRWRCWPPAGNRQSPTTG